MPDEGPTPAVLRLMVCWPLISGVLYDRLRCCCAALGGMPGREGPRVPLPYAFGDDPSLDGARGIAGAVYRFVVSSQGGCGVVVLGKG